MDKSQLASSLHLVNDKLENILRWLTELYEKLGPLVDVMPEKLTSTVYIRKVVNSDDAPTVFAYYSRYAKDIEMLSNMIHIAQKSIPPINHIGTYNGSLYISEQFILDCSAMLDTINDTYYTLTDHNIAVLLDNAKLLDIDIAEASDVYIKHQNAIELYVYILEKHMQNYPDDKKMVSILDDLKLQILFDNDIMRDIKIPTVCTKNAIQTMLTTHNLVPDVSGALPLLDKIYELFRVKVKKFSDVQKIIEKGSGPGLIIINRILAGTGAIDNDISRLLIANKDPTTAGVSEKIIANTTTMNYRAVSSDIVIPAGITVFSAAGKPAAGKPAAGEFYYIIDTVDGNLFRTLKLWKGNNPIPKNMIGSDLKHPSKKIYAYNTILSSAILDQVTRPIIIDEGVSKSSRSVTNVKWNIIRNDIKKRILADFDIAKGKSNKMTQKRFIEIISNPRLYTAPLMQIARALAIQFLPPEYRDDEITLKYIEEIQISTISDIGYMRNGIARYVTIKSNNLQGMISSPTEKLGKILDDALKIFINEKNNIYMTVEMKAELRSVRD